MLRVPIVTPEPTQPTLSGDSGPVERLLAEYLDRRKRGDPPLLEHVLAGLSSADEQKEFQALLRIALEAEVLEPGTLVAHYRIERLLGSGGMGRVYLAFDTTLGKPVAIKLLRPRRETRGRFDQEAQILARLDHPNIVTVHSSGEYLGQPYLVLDVVDGIPLDQLIRGLHERGATHGADVLAVIGRGHKPGQEPTVLPRESYWRAAARIMRDIARALVAAHQQGVLHRDLKPANVMMAGGGLPVVLDFGIATTSEDPAREACQLGTLPYLTPEQRSGGVVDARSDVYQLGLILYELLVWRQAVASLEPTGLLQESAAAAIVRPRTLKPAVPRSLEAICLRALATDPAARYQSAAAMAADLDRYLAWRSTARLVGAILLAVAVGLVCGLMAWSEPGPQVQSIQPFHLPLSAARPTPIFDLQARRGDALCLEIRVARQARVHAISVMVTPSGEYVTRLHPDVDGNGRHEPEGDKLCPVLTPETHHRIAFTKAGSDHTGSSADGPLRASTEEIHVYLTVDRCDWLEQWLKTLPEETGKLTRAAAMKLLRDAGPTRAPEGPLDRLPEEDRDKLARALRPEGGKDWPFRRVSRVVYEFTVQEN